MNPDSCPGCGCRLDPAHRPDARYCDMCGHSLTGTYRVILRYDPGWYIPSPKVRVTLGDREYTMERRDIVRLALPHGRHCFGFRSSHKKKELDLDLQGDTGILIGWDRLKGTMTVEAVDLEEQPDEIQGETCS